MSAWEVFTLIRFRAFDPLADYPSLSQLLSLTSTDPVGPEQLRERDAKQSTEMDRRVLAVDDLDQVVGYSTSGRYAWMKPGCYWLDVIVATGCRRRGIGDRLYQDAERFLLQQHCTLIRAEVRDDAPDSLGFVERRGYTLDRHIFDSVLDLSTVDQQDLSGSIHEGLAVDGFQFSSLAQLTDQAKAQRAVYELFRSTVADIPGEDGGFPSYEDFSRSFFQSSRYRPEGAIVATHGERYVAVSVVGYQSSTNSMTNLGTCVASEYRGRQLAKAVKLQTIRYAKQCGAGYIRTQNDSKNEAMLSVNRKLGYQPQIGTYVMLKHLRSE